MGVAIVFHGCGTDILWVQLLNLEPMCSVKWSSDKQRSAVYWNMALKRSLKSKQRLFNSQFNMLYNIYLPGILHAAKLYFNSLLLPGEIVVALIFNTEMWCSSLVRLWSNFSRLMSHLVCTLFNVFILIKVSFSYLIHDIVGATSICKEASSHVSLYSSY